MPSPSLRWTGFIASNTAPDARKTLRATVLSLPHPSLQSARSPARGGPVSWLGPCARSKVARFPPWSARWPSSCACPRLSVTSGGATAAFSAVRCGAPWEPRATLRWAACGVLRAVTSRPPGARRANAVRACWAPRVAWLRSSPLIPVKRLGSGRGTSPGLRFSG
jgi:hypothetical protein